MIVLPAYVGMILHHKRLSTRPNSAPRLRGDEPIRITFVGRYRVCFPPMRG